MMQQDFWVLLLQDTEIKNNMVRILETFSPYSEDGVKPKLFSSKMTAMEMGKTAPLNRKPRVVKVALLWLNKPVDARPTEAP